MDTTAGPAGKFDRWLFFMRGSAIPEPHLSFYYNRYFKKQLNPGTFGLKNNTVSWIASGMKYWRDRWKMWNGK